MKKQITEKTVDALLDKLVRDDDFRKQFQQNPRAAMVSMGAIDADDDSVPDQPIPNLASKQEIASSRDTLRQSLLAAQSPYVPITLDMPER